MKKYKYSMLCGHFDELAKLKKKSLKIETSSHSVQEKDQELSKKQLVCNCWLELVNNHNDPVIIWNILLWNNNNIIIYGIYYYMEYI